MSACQRAAVRLSCHGKSGSGCSAQVNGGWDRHTQRLGPAHSEARGEKRELGESDARYETLNCPLFHPTIGMEMAHACQGGLGGMTSKETDVIGYEVKPAERR